MASMVGKLGALVFACLAMPLTASAEPVGPIEKDVGFILGVRAGIGRLHVGGHSDVYLRQPDGTGPRFGLSAGRHVTPRTVPIASVDAAWTLQLDEPMGFCIQNTSVGLGVRHYRDRIWLEGRANYDRFEDVHPGSDYSGGSCHRSDAHHGLGGVLRVGSFFSPSSRWSISIDLGASVSLSDDAHLVTVGVNLDWINAH